MNCNTACSYLSLMFSLWCVWQGCSSGWSLRVGGDLPAGGGGQPVRGPCPTGQLRLQRFAFGCVGHIPRWIPTHFKPRWRGQQRGVHLIPWNHMSLNFMFSFNSSTIHSKKKLAALKQQPEYRPRKERTLFKQYVEETVNTWHVWGSIKYFYK